MFCIVILEKRKKIQLYKDKTKRIECIEFIRSI